MILISACLLGENCKYNGGNNYNKEVLTINDEFIPICPEVMGGLGIPRKPCEIEAGFSGIDVLNGKAKVISADGSDVTDSFLKGTYAVLEIAEKNKIKIAYMKQSSPSCGCGSIYNGKFENIKKPGDGVCSAMLKRAGIKVIPL